MKPLFILNDPAYGNERSYNGLWLGGSLSQQSDTQLKVFLKNPLPNSLYDCLGGIYPIAALVDDFIDRVFVNASGCFTIVPQH